MRWGYQKGDANQPSGLSWRSLPAGRVHLVELGHQRAGTKKLGSFCQKKPIYCPAPWSHSFFAARRRLVAAKRS